MTTINDDLIKRSADIRWPVGFDPVHADLFAYNAVVINAPAKSIWATNNGALQRDDRLKVPEPFSSTSGD